ncbi:hypothetical protein SKAU_G00074590 [Synaphobranchus kaupii]|uniref:Uncharacterized protein n=1 Tax=Synaphobranchus kaupii TaxID=118154 RepID=A0A9Q1G7E6_SYNKA|nr:hypothetical protein SKAU_G00074590 [Synaphobranchus kaupii]
MLISAQALPGERSAHRSAPAPVTGHLTPAASVGPGTATGTGLTRMAIPDSGPWEECSCSKPEQSGGPVGALGLKHPNDSSLTRQVRCVSPPAPSLPHQLQTTVWQGAWGA